MNWTEEENIDREMNTMLNPKGKSCANCNWGEGNIEPKERDYEWTTCGHHHQNFKVDSLCAYWTDPNDPMLKIYLQKKYKKLREQIKND